MTQRKEKVLNITLLVLHQSETKAINSNAKFHSRTHFPSPAAIETSSSDADLIYILHI